MVLCGLHVEQGDKEQMKRVHNSSVELLPRVLRAVKFNPALQKKWKKEESRR